MSTETLICQFDGHSWEREKVRGTKPLLCLEHRGKQLTSTAPPEPAKSAPKPSQEASKAAALLKGTTIKPELRRKLQYVVSELAKPPGEDEDARKRHAGLANTRKLLIQEAGRKS